MWWKMQLMEVGNRIAYMELAFERAWNLLQRRENVETDRAPLRGGAEALFTWLGVGDNPDVATSEGEVGDLLHLPSAEGRQPHSIKLEIFALKLDRRARRVCLALGHPRYEPPVQEGQDEHPCADSLSVCSFVLITDEVDDEDDAVSSFSSVGDAQGEGRVDLEPIKGERGDVMRMHECQHQDHCVGPGDARVTKRRLPPVTHHYQP